MATAIWNGAVLAESDTYEEVEGNVYFPPESVKWDYLKPGDRQYTCPWKGHVNRNNTEGPSNCGGKPDEAEE